MEKHISTKAEKKTKNKNTCKQKFDGLILWFPLADKFSTNRGLMCVCRGISGDR